MVSKAAGRLARSLFKASSYTKIVKSPKDSTWLNTFINTNNMYPITNKERPGTRNVSKSRNSQRSMTNPMLKHTGMNKGGLNIVRDLENENTKQMIVSIRKNILSSNITSEQQKEI